ncbi:hypothetical protein R3P38DRAFT_3231381 [Favolaschia claudopus]|uniref:Uncharacterized protein n=1 Tax=Favolaschia claudopus TaxID=2862362 RepID=A0AAV9ZKH9_9AGAR
MDFSEILRRLALFHAQAIYAAGEACSQGQSQRTITAADVTRTQELHKQIIAILGVSALPGQATANAPLQPSRTLGPY